jgi:hypothetical protein
MRHYGRGCFDLQTSSAGVDHQGLQEIVDPDLPTMHGFQPDHWRTSLNKPPLAPGE